MTQDNPRARSHAHAIGKGGLIEFENCAALASGMPELSGLGVILTRAASHGLSPYRNANRNDSLARVRLARSGSSDA